MKVLLLTRRLGEVIVIGTGADAIEIMITQIAPSYVRVGIKAPSDVKILRKEIVERDAVELAEANGNK